MGQQQLLLVILVTIIVGIATVVAINTFGSAADSANIDAVRQDLGQIAASAQGYYMKPEMLGGGGRDFSDISFNNITFAGNVTDGSNASNENGSYELISAAADHFIIEGVPASADDGGGAIRARVEANCMSMGTYASDGSATSPESCSSSSP